MNERQTELVTAARKRAQIRREIRSEKDRIADQLDALCDEIERLSDQGRTLQELFDAKAPLHERRKLPSPTTVSTIAEVEQDPCMLFQQSFWPDCQCVECYAAHKAEEFYIDLLLAVKRLSQASACAGAGPDEGLKWWRDKGVLESKYLPKGD
jgi:uncharacterized protein YhaN